MRLRRRFLAHPGAHAIARRNALAAAAVAVLALATACGPANSGSLGKAPAGSKGPTATPTTPTPTPSGSASAPTDPTRTTQPQPGKTLTFEIWLVRDGALFVASRTRPYDRATGRLALTTLVGGATRTEAAAGVGSAIDSKTTFDIVLRGGVATVDLPASFYSGGRDLARLRQAQIVYTLTQYATISKVGFLKGGAATGWPVGRDDYADRLPRVLVASPSIGQRVSSPVTIAGTAEVFEATVSVRILDSSGREIATRFTTATAGTGNRGSYSVAVPYRVNADQSGTIEAFEVSAKDGSRVHVMRIPVTLTR